MCFVSSFPGSHLHLQATASSHPHLPTLHDTTRIKLKYHAGGNPTANMATQQDLQDLLRLLTVGRKIPMMQAMTQIKALQAADLRR